MQLESRPIKQFVSFAFAGVIGIVILVVTFRTGDMTTWLSVAFGLSAGWSAGILASPYQTEQSRFDRISAAFAGFFAGWAVSKADRVFDLWIDPAKGPLLLQPTFGRRVLLGLTSFLLAATVTYVGRKYFRFGPAAEPQELHARRR
jgi:hypothetical protein